MDAPAFAAGPSSNPGFIHFDMFSRLAANLVALGAHHPGAELMKDAEGGLIARQAELPLKLNGRHSRRLAGDQVSRPEPGRQRRVAALHDGLGHQAYISTTGAAAQNAGARLETVGFANDAAPWANEPSLPAGVFEIGGTGRVVGGRPRNGPVSITKGSKTAHCGSFKCPSITHPSSTPKSLMEAARGQALGGDLLSVAGNLSDKGVELSMIWRKCQRVSAQSVAAIGLGDFHTMPSTP